MLRARAAELGRDQVCVVMYPCPPRLPRSRKHEENPRRRRSAREQHARKQVHILHRHVPYQDTPTPCALNECRFALELCRVDTEDEVRYHRRLTLMLLCVLPRPSFAPRLLVTPCLHHLACLRNLLVPCTAVSSLDPLHSLAQPCSNLFSCTALRNLAQP